MNDLLSEVAVIFGDSFGAGSVADANDGEAECDGSPHDDGISNHSRENSGLRGDFLLVFELVDAELHAHLGNLDVDPGFNGVKYDAVDHGGFAHAGSAEAGGALIELKEFAGEESESNEAQGVGVGGNNDLRGAKEPALRSPHDIRGTVEEHEVVRFLNAFQLIPKTEIDGLITGGIVFVFDIDEVESGWNDIEARQDAFPASVANDILHNQIAEGVHSRIENRIEGTLTPNIQFVPALEAHKPNT